MIRSTEFLVSVCSCLVFAACGGTVIADDGIGGKGSSSNDDGISDDGVSDDGVSDDGVVVGTGGSSTSVNPVGTGGFGGGSSTTASGGSSPVLLIECGENFCDASIEECCVTFGMGQPQTNCVAQNSCPGSSFACSSASSCEDGLVCCLEPAGMMRFEAACRTECMGGPGGQGVQLCESSAECLNQEPCEDTPIGLDVCGGFGGPN